MDEAIRLRCTDIAVWMLAQHATVRSAARQFGVSKSSVHKDMCERLPEIDAVLSRQINALLQYNKAVRHLRGGAATRRLYQERRNQRQT